MKIREIQLKAVIQGKFVVIKILGKEEHFKVNNLCYCLKYLKKEDQIKTEERRKELVKIDQNYKQIKNASKKMQSKVSIMKRLIKVLEL